MKKLENIIILVSALLLSFAMLAGCSKEEDLSALEESSVIFFHAVTESGETKTVLENGDSETASHPVLWTPGDAIWVGTADASGKYVYEGTEETTYADFGGTSLKGSTYYSIYPYSASVSLSDGIISFDMPSTQEYAPLSFGPEASPMAAVSTSTTLEFRNLCGLLKLNLLGEASIRSISFSARDAAGNDMPVSGAATVDMNNSSVPELVMSPDANTTVILNCGEGVALSPSEITPFYIALPPGTYDEFTLNIVSTDGTVMVKNSSGLVIHRSMVKPTAELYFEAGTGELSERDALVAFFNATDGPNWTDNTNWCSNEPLDTWYGVTVDSEGVIGLELQNNGLSGDAGNTLAPLSGLIYLNCYNNSLSGLLDLSGNTALTQLLCSGNSLSELDLSNNAALTTLWCYNNRLNELKLSNNTALTDLTCFNNSLDELDLSSSTALTYLSCSDNRLSSLDLTNNPGLTYLSCANNNLAELDLSRNTQIEELYCYGNHLTMLDIRNLTALGESVLLGCQVNASSTAYIEMTLLLTDEQKVQWDNIWSSQNGNEYVVV